MSNKNVREATDLMRFNCHLRIDCRCGYSRWMGGHEALLKFKKTPIGQYRERLKCSRCGQRGPKVEVSEARRGASEEPGARLLRTLAAQSATPE